MILKISLCILILTFVILVWKTISDKKILNSVLALDLIGITSIAFFLVCYFLTGIDLFLDIAKFVTIGGFVTALVFSTFLSKNEDTK